jgi:biotin-dependent carboxylase-like uncharacterized protein
MLTVVKAGPLTTVQDLGRPGFAHLGVPRSGALDEPAFRAANRLVGNPESAAALEVTLGGFTAVVSRAAVVALTGALAPLRIDGVEAPYGCAVRVDAGARIEVGRASVGVRCYLAVDGGIAVEPVLGSRSTDTLSWLGPPRVVNGAALALGSSASILSTVDGVSAPDRPDEIVLRVRLGPRADWFTGNAIETLFGRAYQVRPESNRVGARLAGAALTRAVAGELPSEGVVLGAVQVPADGRPLVFLADHPTTGGYPVIGVVAREDLPLLAQARPGDTVRLRGLEQ